MHEEDEDERAYRAWEDEHVPSTDEYDIPDWETVRDADDEEEAAQDDDG